MWKGLIEPSGLQALKQKQINWSSGYCHDLDYPNDTDIFICKWTQ
jgi:hypothetical protein